MKKRAGTKITSTKLFPYIIGGLILILGLTLFLRPKAQPLGINEVAINPIAETTTCGQIVKFLVKNQCARTANFKTAQINCTTSNTTITIDSPTCVNVANLFNQAYAKCSKICIKPSPTPVSSSYTSPRPSPSVTSCWLNHWAYREVCEITSTGTTYHYLDFTCGSETSPRTIGSSNSCSKDSDLIGKAKAICASVSCVPPTPTPKPTSTSIPSPTVYP